MKSFNAAENRSSGELLSFRDRFTSSRQFANLYREGMDLVEETADYLDRGGASNPGGFCRRRASPTPPKASN